MKAIPNTFTIGLVAVGFLCLPWDAAAAPSKIVSARTSHKAAAVDSPRTNAVIEIPTSTFLIPANAKEGRDPFFPDSTRVYGTDTPRTKSTNAPVALKLNGLSGTVEKPLAIINGKTFAEGEEGEIQTPAGNQQVRCISIKEDAVEIEIAGQRRQLRLREGL